MAHVEVRQNDRGGWIVLVDGVDLANTITPDGIVVKIPGPGEIPTVAMTLLVDKLDLDVPEAVIEAAVRRSPYSVDPIPCAECESGRA